MEMKGENLGIEIAIVVENEVEVVVGIGIVGNKQYIIITKS